MVTGIRKRNARRIRRGLTLIELLVVLVVIAATAAVVVPRLGFVADQANTAQSAATSADVFTNIETYKASTGAYPDYFESLLDSDDSLPTNFMLTYNATSYTGTQITSGIASSLTRAGIKNVYDLDETKTDPTIKTTSRAIAASGSLATLVSGSTVAKKLYPPNGTLPTTNGTQVVAFGVGSSCSAVGSTMGTAPIFSQAAGKDQDSSGKKDYYRFIAFFEVQESTSYSVGYVCKLKGVVDSNGYTTEQRLLEYKTYAPQ